MIFVDTGVWFASFVQEDPRHDSCRRLLEETAIQLLTTSFVFDELCTLLRARDYQDMAYRYCSSILSEAACRFHWISEEDIRDAWDIFQRFDDKRWSFTDCTSYAVMQRLGISEAFALDDHFRQFGFVTVRP